MRIVSKLALILALTILGAVAHADATVANGTMDGRAVDHSDGNGLLMIPPSWLPVNINTGRGDRLSVEEADRPGGGQCLHVRTFGSDAGVYQSLIPLEKGRSYLISAWVKRLSGKLAIKAYPAAWGPGVMGLLDDRSSGWTQFTVGLTPIDGGAHLYLVAAPEADFLIDDVQIRPASIQVGKPELMPFDFSYRRQYRVSLTPTPDAKLPITARVRAVEVGSSARPLGTAQTVTLAAAESTTVHLNMPLRSEQGFSVEVTDATDNEVLGGSSTARAPGLPWVVRYPYKDSLYASLGYRWPLRVTLTNAIAGALGRLQATCAIAGPDGKTARETHSVLRAGGLQVPLDGSGLAPGDYRLRLTVRLDGRRRVFRSERSLRVLAPSTSEVVVSPDGDTLVNGKRFFPIGLYWVLADPAGWRPGPSRKTADLQELRQAGFNTLHTYAFEHNDANDTDDNAEAYLDIARDLGFMVMMGLRRDWYQGKELNAAEIEQRVARLRSHPALLCWTLWDEPDSNIRNVPRVQAVYDIVNQTDPYHPAMPVFMSGGGRPFRNAADINLFDRYPGAGNAGVLPSVFQTSRAAIPEKPLWYVAQAYQQGNTVPSEQDMRLYWHHALDADAKAIFWYSYGGDAKGWDSIRITPEHFANVKRAVRALADAVEGQ